AGITWMQRLTNTYPAAAWLNPVNENYWDYTHSIRMIREVMQNRMYPLTLEGLDDAMRELTRKR
ncbi:MAG TPA: VWA domain-containing protein, partial [Rhizorhapis sp.]